MVDSPHLHDLNKRLIISTSEAKPSYLLIGRRGNYIKLSSSSYYLLRYVNAGISFEKLAEQLSKQCGHSVQTSEVETAYKQVVEDITKIETKEKNTPIGFWLRCQLVPANIVEHIAKVLSFAFHPIVFILLLISSITLLTLEIQNIFTSSFYSLGNGSFGSGFILFLISLLIHELGHASACMRFGMKPKEIGFLIYWIYPAFYSNVNEAWQLNRWQRVIVDLGGVFFQTVFGIVLLGIYHFYKWDAGRLGFVLITYNASLSLNPFLKFDGYWVVADAFGIVNLRQQVQRIIVFFYNRIVKRSTSPRPWSITTTIVISVYAITSISFWTYLTWRIAPEVWIILITYPYSLAMLIQELIIPPHRLATGRLHSVFSTTFIVVGVILILYNIAHQLYKLSEPLLARIIQSIHRSNRVAPDINK